jgi:DNA-binding transcriptional LysR family regulator
LEARVNNPLARIDWNLVPVLDALLRERNVSRAARILGISQPTASGALARLRRFFDDELLVRNGNGFVLSPLAQTLAPLARDSVERIEGVLHSDDAFDPSTCDREFVVRTTEYGQILLGADLIERVLSQAPQARVRFVGRVAAGSPADWLAAIDGWFAPRDALPDMPCTAVHQDRWVCIARRDHPRVQRHLAVADVESLDWVVPVSPRDGEAPWLKRLLAHDAHLPIVAVTESFSAMPFLITGTDRVGIVQADLARRFADLAGLQILETPWPMAPLSLTMWWHPHRLRDNGHRWFREQVDASMTAVPTDAQSASTTDAPAGIVSV